MSGNPVVIMLNEVISVIPSLLGFFCSMAILMNLYLGVPNAITETFVSHAVYIINSGT
jgi:hypothetical protein